MGTRTTIGLTAYTIGLATTVGVLAAAQQSLVPAFGLEWRGSEGCPTREQVVEEVWRLLGSQPQSTVLSGGPQFSASAERAGAGWRVVVNSNAGGERVLEGDTCKHLSDGVALIIALALDPERVVATRELSNPTVPSASIRPVPAASGYLPPPPPESVRSANAWVASMQGLGSLGTFPGPAVGMGGSVGWVGSHVRFDIGGMLWPNQRSYITSNSAYGGDFRLLGGVATSCFLPGDQTAKVRFDVCSSLEFGQMRGTGVGVTSPGQGGSLWVAWTAGGGGRWILGEHASIRLSIAAGIPLFRPRFILEEVGPVHRPNAIHGRVALGPELYF